LKNRSNSRLAARTRLIYFTISTVTVTALMIIVAFIANGIANDASQRIARQYSIEAAGNFQAHINPHLTLMLQLARSTTIARWLADDDNEAAKDFAFDEIIGYAHYMPSSRFMLTAYRSRNIYDFLPGSADWLAREDFVSLGLLPDGEEAQWFFNTRDDILPFNLNIQREMEVQGLDPDTLQMWANHRVYYRNTFVGVVAIGFPFRYIFDPTFGTFAVGEMRGYIIDRYGGVRVDSAELLDVFDDGLPTFPIVPEAYYNTNLLAHIDRHLLQRIDGIYQLGAYTFEAIGLARGDYSHASIAPITGTDWSIVVLSHQPGLFDFQYMPLIYVVVAVMILSLLTGSVMMRRVVIVPLLNLTESAAHINESGSENLFGMDRPDEIGDLARTIYRAQEEIKEMHEEHQRLEIAEEKNKAKSEFLARMSHEIRTPISAVLGISEIGLQTPGIPPSAEESFTKIYNSGKLLLGIINDILDFSKIEGGKMEIAISEYDTSSLINNAANLHYAYVGDKNIKFNLFVDENLPAALYGDTLRIEQIIINILSNAFKYTDSGSVELSLKCLPLDAEHINLAISIKDTGLGMSPEQLETVFNDYTRFHEREKSGVSGTGLGMSIVSNLAELMGAKIDIQSGVGIGTTVTINIPQKIAVKTVLGAEAAARLQQFELYAGNSEKLSKFQPEPMPYGYILVVDDIDANLYVAQGLLAFYGLNIETCKSGYEAIEKVRQGSIYDIIFMDHMMPGLNGPDTMVKLREMGYEHPIVVLTANALAGQEEEYIKSGFDSFLSKPIMTDKLNNVLIKYVKEKQPPEVIEEAVKNHNKTQKQGAPQDIDAFRNDVYVLGKLRSDFAKNHKNDLSDLAQAIEEGDTETAHLMAHTLKGLAALIHEPVLSQIAEDIENLLADGRITIDDKLSALDTELNRVFESINKIEAKELSHYKGYNKERALSVLNELQPLLEQRNLGAMKLIDDIRMIPETAVLVKQIEKMALQNAHETLKTLITVIEG